MGAAFAPGLAGAAGFGASFLASFTAGAEAASCWGSSFSLSSRAKALAKDPIAGTFFVGLSPTAALPTSQYGPV
jgi:hypothetical protein